MNTWRNNDVVISSKRRHFDVITTPLLRNVLAVALRGIAGTDAILDPLDYWTWNDWYQKLPNGICNNLYIDYTMDATWINHRPPLC